MAKGLLRNEIICSKEILETVVRPMFMKVIEWKIGIENDFNVSFGKALFLLIEIFQETSNYVAQKLNFNDNRTEEQSVISLLRNRYYETKYRS